MLSHRYRFHGHRSLHYVYQHGERYQTKALTLRYVKNTRRVHSRYAVIISKKVLKLAVKRNRLRRRIYEIIRQHQDALPQGYDVAISVFSSELLELPHVELTKQLEKLFKQGGLVK